MQYNPDIDVLQWYNFRTLVVKHVWVLESLPAGHRAYWVQARDATLPRSLLEDGGEGLRHNMGYGFAICIGGQE